ncbi:MAG: fused MFS/spermidine synthase [Candidatus Micrarchaeia archaeon]
MEINKRALFAVVFIAGACSMLVEIAGGRTLYPYLGNTIYTWTGTIAVVLGALSLGYWAGGKAADKLKSPAHLSRILLLAGMLTVAVPPLTLVAGELALDLPVYIAALLAPLILAPASFFYGMVSPYAIKIVSKKGKEGTSVGTVFSLSTAGSIAGVVITGFLLVPNMSLTHIYILGGLLMGACSAALCRKGVDNIERAVFALVLLGVMIVNPSISYDGQIFQKNGHYALITVLEKETPEGVERTLLLDNALSSGETNGKPSFEYVIMAARVFDLVESPSRGLVLGCAAGTQVELLKRRYPQIYVDGVDIDPSIVQVGREYFSLNDSDGRTSIYIEDARRFLHSTNSTYDIVFIDAFRAHSPPPHLASVEFVRLLKSRMGAGGAVAVNLIAREDSDYLKFVYGTYSEVFRHVYVFPVQKWDGKKNIILIATDSESPEFVERYGHEMIAVERGNVITDDRNPSEIFGM